MSLLLTGLKCLSNHNREGFSKPCALQWKFKKKTQKKRKKKDFLSSSILGLIVLAQPEFLRDDFALTL